MKENKKIERFEVNSIENLKIWNVKKENNKITRNKVFDFNQKS